jgi:hypothetical protein
MNVFQMAEKVETRWDGITTVAATLGITVVATASLVTGQVRAELLYVVVAALSGIGGYSMHNVVRRNGGSK